MTRDLTLRYTAIQSFYWMGFATISGFASVFLLAMGFSNTRIGFIMAISGLVSAAVQPIAATLAEGGPASNPCSTESGGWSPSWVWG